MNSCGGRPPPYPVLDLADPVPPRLRAAILALLALVTVASLVGTALSPYLLVKSPLLLVAI